jgi:hypothetical protein
MDETWNHNSNLEYNSKEPVNDDDNKNFEYEVADNEEEKIEEVQEEDEDVSEEEKEGDGKEEEGSDEDE